MLLEQPQDLLFSAAAQVMDDEALAAQIADVDIGTLGQRVTWRRDQDQNLWDSDYLASADYARFLKKDYDQARAVFSELGLARKDF